MKTYGFLLFNYSFYSTAVCFTLDVHLYAFGRKRRFPRKIPLPEGLGISVKLLEEHSRGDINPFGIFDMLLKQLDMPTARYVRLRERGKFHFT